MLSLRAIRPIFALPLLAAAGTSVQAQDVPMKALEEIERQTTIEELESLLQRSQAAATAAQQALSELQGTPLQPRRHTAAPGTSALESRIVNGVFTVGFPSVGMILRNNGGVPHAWCSGTLIGCDTVLTAAHCVDDNPAPSDLKVYFQNVGVVEVSDVRFHPGFSFPNADVAVLRLAEPVAGIPTSAINRDIPIGEDVQGTIVGFGRSGGSNDDYGLKRLGQVRTAACNAPFSSTNLICWNFTSPLGPAGLDSNTCNADSGGPLFSAVGAPGLMVSGVTSGGINGSCLPTDHSYDARVSTFADWIVANSGDLGPQQCGVLPAVGDPQVTMVGDVGTLSAGQPQGLHSFTVPAGTQLLRVALNGEDNFVNEFDLYVRQGAVPTSNSFDCAGNDQGQFAGCEIPGPAAGQWFAMVERVTGQGTYQVVATSFGAAPDLATVTIDFEQVAGVDPTVDRQAIHGDELKEDGGVTFQAVGGSFADAAVGVVRNGATSACVESKGLADRLLATGRGAAGTPASVGLAGFPLELRFDPPVQRVALDFQGPATPGPAVRLTAFDGSIEVSRVDGQGDPDGDCGFPGSQRGRGQLEASVMDGASISRATVEVVGGGRVFGIDNLELARRQ